MSRLWRTDTLIARIKGITAEVLSAEHPIRAVFADATLVLLGNIVLWDTSLDIAGRLGRKIELGELNVVAIAALLGAIMTLPFSAVALLATRFIHLRAEPRLTPKGYIAMLVIASVPVSVLICTPLIFHAFSQDSLFVGLFVFGLCAVPAAFRFTGRTAFLKRGWYRDNPSSYHGAIED